jgi:2-aminoadipate transaminase
MCLEHDAMALSWEQVFRGSEKRLRGSAIRDLLAVTARPDVISFAGGLPAPELFPVEAVRESFDRVLRNDGADAIQYGATEGFYPLRVHLAECAVRRGMKASPENILITTGSQQALLLLSLVLVQPGKGVMVESPSYVGALQAFTLREPRYYPVGMDDDGMQTDEARLTLAKPGARIQLIYSVATFQNPSGVTMSLERRKALLDLSNSFGVPMIEDDPYGDLRYSGLPLPSFRALLEGDDAVYLGTFSKTLAPGLRLGYVVGPTELIAKMVLAKQAADLHTDSLSQRALLDFCTHNDLDQHVTVLRDVYRTRRDAMLSAMDRYFPASCRWTRPEGGLFTWVTLPDHADATVLLADSLRQNVAFVPGDAFFTDGTGANTLRLNFSHPNPAKIEVGIRRLGGLLHAQVPESDGPLAAASAN